MSTKSSQLARVISARFAADFDGVDAHAKEIAARLVQLVALFEQKNHPLFEYHQVNRGMFSALVCLRLAGKPYELRHRDLIDRMLITSGGVTNLCRRLERLGLIEKHTDPDDKRSALFRLSEPGIAMADELLPSQHRIECELVGILTADEQQQLCNLLEKLTQPFDP